MLQVYPTTLLAVILLGCVYAYRKWSARTAFQRAEARHGCQRPRRYPHRDPIWGYDLHRIRLEAAQRGQFYKLYDQHFELYGKTFEEIFFDKKVINSMEPANVQQVAVLSWQDWGKVASRTAASAPVLGNGIFSQDGAAWRRSRELIKPTFSRSEIADLGTLRTYTDRLLDLLPRDGSTTDVQPLLHRFFLDVSTDFIFGASVDAMLPDTPFDSLEFIQAFNESLAGIGRRRRVGRMRFLYAFDRKWKQSYSKVHAFIDAHVARALEETAPNREEASNGKPHARPGRFLLLREMAKAVRDPLELRYQILNVFLAARDTTSILLANALFQLARNPHVWAAMHRAALALGAQPLTYDVIQSLTLFRNVLYEVFRHQGPAARVFREAVRDTILPVGGGPDGQAPILVAQGTWIALNTASMNHDRDLWGADAHEFRPERWADPHRAAPFVPFFTGPRVCPAQQQVLTQAAYVLVRLAREFAALENRDPVWEYVEVTRLVTESRNGVKVAFIPAARDPRGGG
ncbi:hypothetical protein MMC11_005097 [Xylographa trunciseda]|nr:hypothetical protein [Xylographa trunciseda]